MSRWYESYGGPGTVGVILGLVVLLSFGGLSIAMWDGRFNGDNATALVNEIRENEFEIKSLREEIEWTEGEMARQESNQLLSEKIASMKQLTKSLKEKSQSVKESIDEEYAKIDQLGQDRAAYREEYRTYERTRAIGETFESITLENGRVLSNVKIQEVFPDRVSFSTEFGSSSVKWKDLPESWSSRFQAGEEELESFKAAVAKQRKERELHFATLGASKQAELKTFDQQRRLRTVKRSLAELTADIAKATGQLTESEDRLRGFLSRAKKTQGNGASTSYRNSIATTKTRIQKLETSLELAKKRKAQLESELETLEKALGS